MEPKRSIEALLKPLRNLSGLEYAALGGFAADRDRERPYTIPRFSVRGRTDADPIRIGVFAALHGDEPAGAVALVEFLRELAVEPALSDAYHIVGYPVCNPAGYEHDRRCSHGGVDLNREFWKGSVQPEVRILEGELLAWRFHGIIQLHTDDTSKGIYGYVRGATLTRHLLRPALKAAESILARNPDTHIDGFPARDGIIYEGFDGILRAPAEMDPVPFEIVFETPHLAPMEKQVAALVLAQRTILSEYRRFIAFAQNI